MAESRMGEMEVGVEEEVKKENGKEDVEKEEEEEEKDVEKKGHVEQDIHTSFNLFMRPPVRRTSNLRGIRKIFYVLGVSLWIFGLGFGIFGVARVIATTWRHYQESPTVISMERDYKEWNTSFPAVTICPTKKYDNDSLNEVVNALPYKDKVRLRKFLIALSQATYGTFHQVPEFPQISSSDYMNLILGIRHKFSYTISGSSSEVKNVGFLTPTVTEHGLCYSFNSKIAIYNSPELWESESNVAFYSKDRSIVGSPLDGDTFAQFMDMSSGYIVFIHGSNETADFSSQSFKSNEKEYKTLTISALSIYSTDEIRSLSVEQRDCRFLEESNLVTSPVYSYNLCRNQCRMKRAYRLCKCVPHFYKPTHEIPICDVEGMRCLATHQGFLANLRDPKTGKKINCNCVPACNDVNYVIENEHNMPWFLGTTFKYGMINYPKMRLKRDTLFGFRDVLISVGGSIALFLGCSLLSLIEIVLFLCVRLYRGIRRITQWLYIRILIKIFGSKHKYLTTAPSDRSLKTATPIPAVQCDEENGDQFVQHI